MTRPPDVYTHGHHESVLRAHSTRTAANSAAYLLPHLGPGMDVLDIGCGPGTITLDLAQIIEPGSIVGMDAVADVVQAAEELRHERRVENCRFEPGDIYGLVAADDTYDVVHAHQVLQHLSDPVAALVEMRRVTKVNGIVAIRDADYAGMEWAPAEPLLDRWLELYEAVTERNGAEADAGRYLLGWAEAAGFTAITSSASTWTFATPSRRAWWAAQWAERVRESSFGTQAIDYELCDRAELDAIADAWERWATHTDGYFSIPHGEIIATK